MEIDRAREKGTGEAAREWRTVAHVMGSEQKRRSPAATLTTSKRNCSFVKDAINIGKFFEKSKKKERLMWFYTFEGDAFETITHLETGAQVLRSGEGEHSEIWNSRKL